MIGHLATVKTGLGKKLLGSLKKAIQLPPYKELGFLTFAISAKFVLFPILYFTIQ